MEPVNVSKLKYSHFALSINGKPVSHTQALTVLTGATWDDDEYAFISPTGKVLSLAGNASEVKAVKLALKSR